jgi:hypothetical protein
MPQFNMPINILFEYRSKCDTTQPLRKLMSHWKVESINGRHATWTFSLRTHIWTTKRCFKISFVIIIDFVIITTQGFPGFSGCFHFWFPRNPVVWVKKFLYRLELALLDRSCCRWFLDVTM